MLTYPAFLAAVATLVAASPLVESTYTSQAKYASEKVQPLMYTSTNVQANKPLGFAENGATQDTVKTYDNPKPLGYEKKPYTVNEYASPPEHTSTHSKEPEAYSPYGQEITYPTDEKTTSISKPEPKSSYTGLPHSAYSTKPEPVKEIAPYAEHQEPETYGKAKLSANEKKFDILPSYTKPIVQAYDAKAVPSSTYEQKKDEAQSSYDEKKAEPAQAYGPEKTKTSSGSSTVASSYIKKPEEKVSIAASPQKSVYSTISKSGYENIQPSLGNNVTASSYTKNPEENMINYSKASAPKNSDYSTIAKPGYENMQSTLENNAITSAHIKKPEENQANITTHAAPPKLVDSTITSYGVQGYEKSQSSLGSNIKFGYIKKPEEEKVNVSNAAVSLKTVYSTIAKPGYGAQEYETIQSPLGSNTVASGYVKNTEGSKQTGSTYAAPPKLADSAITSYEAQGYEKIQSSSGINTVASGYASKPEQAKVSAGKAAAPQKSVHSAKPSYENMQFSYGNKVVAFSHTKKPEESKASKAASPPKSVYSAKPSYNMQSTLGNNAITSAYTKQPEQAKASIRNPAVPPKSAYSTVAKTSYGTQVAPQSKGLPAFKSNPTMSFIPNKAAKKVSSYPGFTPATVDKDTRSKEANSISKYHKDTPKYY